MAEIIKIKLLMVDDEQDFLLSSATALSRRGFEVDTAPDGITALNEIKRKKYDVIVLDVKMPGIDGVDVFLQIQKEYPDLPVILLTGHGSVSQAFQTSKAGVYDYLSKPCDMEVLAEKLRKAAALGKYGPETPGSMPQSMVPVNVLLVDDEIEFLDSLQKVLGRRNMKVTTANNGQQALEILDNTLIDIVVLDIKMPGIDGIDVLHKIKADYPRVEVVLLTGHPTVNNALEGIKSGAFDYLVKPPDIEKLVSIIGNAYARRTEKIAEEEMKRIKDIRERFPE